MCGTQRLRPALWVQVHPDTQGISPRSFPIPQRLGESSKEHDPTIELLRGHGREGRRCVLASVLGHGDLDRELSKTWRWRGDCAAGKELECAGGDVSKASEGRDGISCLCEQDHIKINLEMFLNNKNQFSYKTVSSLSYCSLENRMSELEGLRRPRIPAHFSLSLDEVPEAPEGRDSPKATQQ